jgi:hypothetical protein
MGILNEEILRLDHVPAYGISTDISAGAIGWQEDDGSSSGALRAREKRLAADMNDYISRPEDERVDRHFEDIRRAFGYERIF